MNMSKVNYTEQDVTKLKALYAEKGNAGLKEIAESMGKPLKSVIGKLVNLKAYVADEKPEPKAKDEGPTKKELLSELESLVPFAVDGLAPAKKEVIAGILDFAKSVKAASAE
jgi:hypothetical protein